MNRPLSAIRHPSPVIRRCLHLCLLVSVAAPARAQRIVVGSKAFTESYVLGEIAKRVLESAGFKVEHRQGMGKTVILWQALKSGQISCYPDYTGTIGEELLKAKGDMMPDAMRRALAPYGVGMTGDLGFNDTYALAMRTEQARRLGIRTIGDLRAHPDLRVVLSHEFLERKDGWRPLSARYGLNMSDVKGVEHSLGYGALLAGTADIIDAYSTDAKLADPRFTVLTDDLGFFPKYRAVFLYRLEMPPKALAALRTLEGKIDEKEMVRLNAEAERTKNYALAAASFFGAGARSAAAQQQPGAAAEILRLTGLHLELVAVSLGLAILVGVPLGIVASRPGALSQGILGVTGVIQTIPSLALLALLVPIGFLGISWRTAIVALFLYSLLPIVRNTATGLQDIPAQLRESAAVLGLTPAAQLGRIYLPMASRTILAGVKTSAIINVGTATLAALIGVECLGTPIMSGLNLVDPPLILRGAVPAAVLALLVQLFFDGLDRLLIPRGLRLPAARK